MTRRKEPHVVLSPKWGVNPMVSQCLYCLKETGLALLGKLKGDAEAPGRGVVDDVPCPECASYMEQGVIMVSVRDGDEASSNPWRTGGWAVVKDDAIRRMVNPPELAEDICRRRFVYVPDAAWTMLGLPAGEGDDE